MLKASNLFLVVLSCIYPVIIYFSFRINVNYIYISFGTALYFVLIFTFSKLNSGKSLISLPLLIAIILLSLLGLYFREKGLVLLYPVLINLSLLITFGLSLLKGKEPIVETIARKMEKDFDERAIVYTRKVTWVWVSFFAMNGLVSYYTFYIRDIKTWTLYNTIISYALMGLIFGLEYLTRRHVKSKLKEGDKK